MEFDEALTVNRSRKIRFLVGFCPALRLSRPRRVTPSLSSIAHRLYLSIKNFAAFGKSKRSLVKKHSLRKNESAKSIFVLLILATPMGDTSAIWRLPFKDGPPVEIGESYDHAKQLIAGLNRRFKSDPALRAEYTAFMDEYEKLGHMKKVTINATNSQRVYIPHHPVIREHSLTTHLRVVFNASSRTTNATSLNDHLHVGPKLQTDLAAVLLRWRQHRYVYSADIAKMYRQIQVDPRDLNYQCIL